jgi:hypothetical protein
VTTTTTTTPVAIAAPSVAEAVARCQAGVRAQTVLTHDERAQLEALCELELTSGSPNSPAAVAAKRRICLTVVKDSGVRGAAARAARRRCRRSGRLAPPAPAPQGAPGSSD